MGEKENIERTERYMEICNIYDAEKICHHLNNNNTKEF